MTAPVSRDTAAHYRWGEDCDGWHLHASTALSVIEERVPPGQAEVRHRHQRAEQFFYVLAGRAHLECDGAVHVLGPGEGLSVPAGTPHQLCNESGEELRFLVVSAPPSHGDRVVEG